MSKKQQKEIDRKFAREVVYYLAENLLRDGSIDAEGKTDEELGKEIKETLLKIASSIQLVTDYTVTILQRARHFKKTGESQVACLFYALWFEHQLNSIISTLAQRNGLSEKEIESLIRETSYRAKCSWLLRLFKLKPLNTQHINTICKLMDLRNAFVHYKWKPDNEQMDKELQVILAQIEKAVTYLRRFENKYIYKSQKKRVRSII